ncbi:MAG: tetratricopeptide repeat protein [Deltaproteobacteria bacterium]|jgi:tetratricopeptide (TPR) repeat protein
MSYINEALKKAQRERDALSLKYSAIMAAFPKKENPLGVKTVRAFLLVMTVVLLAFVFYSQLKVAPAPVEPKRYVKPRKPTPPASAVQKRSAQEIYEEAKRFHDLGELEKAGKLYEETLRLDPGHVEALNNLGVIYLQRKDLASAQENFLKAIRLRPQSADPHYNLACLYALKGELNLGMAHLKKAASLERSAKVWAKEDKDLENLQRLPEFHVFVAGDDALTDMEKTP